MIVEQIYKINDEIEELKESYSKALYYEERQQIIHSIESKIKEAKTLYESIVSVRNA